ncbi:MAG: methyltransferase domain-containing protein [Pseudonocardiaceae bacterium]
MTAQHKQGATQRTGGDAHPDTAYDAPTSASYVEADDKLVWALGYPFALRALGVGGPDAPATLLDYGCGPGKIARRVARTYGMRVVAVDASAEMLAIAAQRHGHSQVQYHRVEENRLTFLADASVDAAMSCFVFVVLPAREQLRAIAAEVWRVLRPGGRFAVLDPHPDHVGVQFSTFRSGEPGVTYQEGDPRAARLLLTDGTWLELDDYFWSARTYEEVLAEAGFTDVQAETPLLADAYGLADPADLDAWDYEVERVRPPLLLVHGRRPGI